jgi:hypothetical protein
MEIVICEALPPVAERDTLRSYLAAKWSVPLSVPPDTTPPAAVTDLVVTARGIGEVTLTWTAPGDDGMTGQASSYDIRYSTAPIDDANWLLATQTVGEPPPQPAGAAESFVIAGLQTDRPYWFALKTLDDAIPPNASPLSPGSPLGDLDLDLDIDLDDFALFAAAMTDPGVPTSVDRADLDGDRDCDLADVWLFAMGLSGQ